MKNRLRYRNMVGKAHAAVSKRPFHWVYVGNPQEEWQFVAADESAVVLDGESFSSLVSCLAHYPVVEDGKPVIVVVRDAIGHEGVRKYMDRIVRTATCERRNVRVS